MVEDLRQNSEKCPVDDLGAYLDGELSADARDAIERHVASCADCNRELNFQKKILLALESPLSDDDVELPKDFTKKVVVNAETRVNGLRRPKERLDALFIAVALLLFSLFALGTDARRTFGVVGAVFETMSAVVGTTAHFVLDMGIAGSVILRTLFVNAFSGISGAGIFAVVVFVILAAVFSRSILKQGRA